MNVLKMQNVAIRNSHLLRDKICKHISQNYNLIIVHIQSAHDERVRRARTTLTIIGLVLIESAIVLISRARTCSRGCKPEKKVAQEAAIFAWREANGIEIKSGEINAETQRRVLNLLCYHDVRHDCSKHSVIVMEADGNARECLVSRVFSSFKTQKRCAKGCKDCVLLFLCRSLFFYIFYVGVSFYIYFMWNKFSEFAVKKV